MGAGYVRVSGDVSFCTFAIITLYNVYSDYISLLSDDENKSPSHSPVQSPSPPPLSPISQDETIDKYVHTCAAHTCKCTCIHM